jgi:hypothetical protein
MPSYVTPTTPAYQVWIAPQIVTNNNVVLGSNSGNTLLDLREARGAWVYSSLGRGTGTPTRQAELQIRRLPNGSGNYPSTAFDRVSSAPTTAAGSSTLSAALATNSATLSLNTAPSPAFAVGDRVCVFNSAGTAIQFGRLATFTSTTAWTAEDNWAIVNAIGDTVTNLADVFQPFWIPGQGQYRIKFNNYSGISYIPFCAVDIDYGDTINP